MIPKIIHQTLPDKQNMHPAFARNIQRLQELNPDWEYRLYDDHDIRTFIGIHYSSLYPAFHRINLEYGVCRADFFRYLLMYRTGGVYLDIKSTATQPLDNVLLPDDTYLLSHWNQHACPGAGYFPLELRGRQELQQWHIVAEPEHPFLAEVIAVVTKNILDYQPYKGVGKLGVLRLTGPLAYTKAIQNIRSLWQHKHVDILSMGFEYSIFPKVHEHIKYYKQKHYSELTSPIVRD